VGLFFIPMLYVLIQGAAYMVARNKQAIQGSGMPAPVMHGGHD